MGMSTRVARLRQQSLDAKPTLSPERAELMTRFYQEHTARLSAPVERARSFEYLLAHKTICINDGELIVGEKGTRSKSDPHLSRTVLPLAQGPGYSEQPGESLV